MRKFHSLLLTTASWMHTTPRGVLLRAPSGGGGLTGYGNAYGQSYGSDGSPAPDPTVYVFALLGQSNMVGRDGPIDSAGLDATDANILSMNFTSGLLETATDPLDHFDEQAGHIGPGLSFAKAFLTANPGKKVVLIPAALGGSGFLRGDWNRKDAQYQAALARLESGWVQALTEDANAAFGGFLWAQGEDEVQDYSLPKLEYEAIVRQFIYYLRADFSAAGATTPFLMGGMPPSWVSTQGAIGTGVQEAIAETAAIVPNVAYADPVGLSSKSGEIIHFSAAAYRTMGSRYHTALSSAQSSVVAAPTLPARPAGNLAFHFDHTGVPDGNPIFENSGNDLPFRNRGVYLSGGKMVFSGKELRIEPADFAGLGSADFRLEVTFQTTSTAKQGIVSQWTQTGNQRSWMLRLGTGGILEFVYSLDGSGGTSALSPGAISTNTEYTVVVERIGGNMEMFLDGVSVSTHTLPAPSTTFFSSSGTTEIGDQNAANPFIGTMSVVSLDLPQP